MAEDKSVIVSAPGSGPDDASEIPVRQRPYKKIIIFAALIASIGVLALAIFLIVRKFTVQEEVRPVVTQVEIIAEVASSTPVLPAISSPVQETPSVSGGSLSGSAVEYLSFDDFYSLPADDLAVAIDDYQLPVNVKIDVMNYYDVSRKLVLDPHLDSLNNQGFAIIDNPWSKSAGNFSEIYAQLDSKQIPFLITTDYLLFYYQNILKKVFKDVEENVFYDNLWDINSTLYQAAKNRYETRLAAIGNINDPVLEAERLETAFFAVALELLKPAKDQVSPKGAPDNKEKFTSGEADRFYFVVPPYLKDDVLSEVSLIRSAQAVRAKSPVMLYNRNYREFSVPSDYKENAKLSNFYLTTKWLNSVFPLNYQDQSCPDCLLDRADWRISLTAASLIAQDFSARPELSSRWARIYKMVSFFRGLREDYNYIIYRDSLAELFGQDFKSEDLFDAKNPEASANLESFRLKLLEKEWPDMSGALDHASAKPLVGFRMLAETYWPNDYIFRKLISPAVGDYIGTTTELAVQTLCEDRGSLGRCRGSALDIVNLVYPISENDYFSNNANYFGYDAAVRDLRRELADLGSWHIGNYWSNLNLIKQYLSVNKDEQPSFAQSADWNNRSLRSAAGAWVNLQLPLQKYSISAPASPDKTLGFSREVDNSYIEPNLALINGILANTNMLVGMFSALQLDLEVRLAVAELKNFASRLSGLKEIVIKELQGEALSAEDNERVADFVREFQVSAGRAADQKLKLAMPVSGSLNLDLGSFKLLVLIHQQAGNKVFSVGPVWDYQESR